MRLTFEQRQQVRQLLDEQARKRVQTGYSMSTMLRRGKCASCGVSYDLVTAGCKLCAERERERHRREMRREGA